MPGRSSTAASRPWLSSSLVLVAGSRWSSFASWRPSAVATLDRDQLHALRGLRCWFGDLEALRVLGGQVTPKRDPQLRRPQVPNLVHPAQASLLA